MPNRTMSVKTPVYNSANIKNTEMTKSNVSVNKGNNNQHPKGKIVMQNHPGSRNMGKKV
jgi:hypothetical protein